MLISKTVRVEVDLHKRPFQAGESLFRYAERILREEGIAGAVVEVDTRTTVVEVTTYGDPRMKTAGGPETVVIKAVQEGRR